ncbi:TonB-dependent receptor [Pedobacter arcticus]|uniref:TonB-dependent receptor n=1 Tax=Pedobacter arcticus TaxID=752140 RepID=UPI0012B58E87|nr:TonB-dependent receptor plug domain-containing protein [Pedobacter arcticus]
MFLKIHSNCFIKFAFSIFFFLLASQTTQAQTLKKDSTQTLQEVTVKAYLSDSKLFNLPSTVTVIAKKQIEQNQSVSLLPVLNSVAGVKMEERSPGSYRLSIRGSLLRSPFGVRNVKVYFDGLPLTDASGNTYLNLIDQSAINNIEVLKGPDGSLFGANSGGVLLINSQGTEDEINVNASAGSYGFFGENVHVRKNYDKYQYSFHQAYQYADGYRDQSLMKRSYFQTQQKFQYNPKAELKFSGFYSDLGYQTPGGLTASQLQANPQQSRPEIPAKPPRDRVPSAAEQKAGIYNQTFFGGITHQYQFNKNWKHSVFLSGTDVDFENPFITNYEKRKEVSWAVRTFVSYQKEVNTKLKYNWNLGYEYQHTNSEVRNYDNNQGKIGNIQAADLIKNESQFLFTRLKFELDERLSTELSTSLNFAKYGFEALPESQSNTFGTVKLNPELMPRVALSYLIGKQTVLRGIVSRGYSTPTKDEIRASDVTINPNLQAENGWNYELGLRTRTPFERVYLDISAFYYRLNNAIVRRVAPNDQDFYVNAGGTNQKGLEIELNANLLKNNSGFFKQIDFSTAVTLNDFKFRDYVIGGDNFSGKLLTGIPKANFSSSVNFNFQKNINLFIQHQYNGKTSLNDAETVFAKSYHLLDAKLSWQKSVRDYCLTFSFGANNILNTNYSLGNDLNAFGARYFNPAAKRSFVGGISLRI